jgi:hypothetical protein
MLRLTATEGAAQVEVSSGDGRPDPLPNERTLRCLACGQRFLPVRLDGRADRCRACAESNRPVDLVMRWIWAEDDSAA